MSLYQFQNYLGNIAEIEKMFSGAGDESTKKEPVTDKELIERARQKGLPVPKHY